jgi:hypothetical protein
MNGDFSDTSGTPFANWQTESSPFIEAPSAGSGNATFVVDGFFDNFVQIEQIFTLPNNASKLSFDFKLSSVTGGFLDPAFGAPPYDGFQASLLDPISLTPLLSFNPFDDRFFGVDVTGNVTASGVSVAPNVGNGFTGVTADVSTVQGRQALLDFRLLGEDDGLITTVHLDNVGLEQKGSSVVPEPISILCWLPACLPLLCRRRSQRTRALALNRRD